MSNKKLNLSVGNRSSKTPPALPKTDEEKEEDNANKDYATLAPLFPVERACFDGMLYGTADSHLNPDLMPGEHPWNNVLNFYLILQGGMTHAELLGYLDRKLVKQYPRFRGVVELDGDNYRGIRAEEEGRFRLLEAEEIDWSYHLKKHFLHIGGNEGSNGTSKSNGVASSGTITDNPKSLIIKKHHYHDHPGHGNSAGLGKLETGNMDNAHLDAFVTEAAEAERGIELKPQVLKLFNQLDKEGLDRKKPLWKCEFVQGELETVVVLRVDQALVGGMWEETVVVLRVDQALVGRMWGDFLQGELETVVVLRVDQALVGRVFEVWVF